MLFTCRESTKSLMFRPYLSSVILAEVCYFCLEKKEKTKKERGKVELKFFNNFPFVFLFFVLLFFCFFEDTQLQSMAENPTWACL